MFSDCILPLDFLRILLDNASFLPVFIGMCIDGGDGDSSDAGDGDNSDGVNDGGPDSSPSDNSKSDNSGPPQTGPSTPFLATWDGSSFRLENDFLFGKPFTNNGDTFESANAKYLSNTNQGDLYIIQNRITPFQDRLIFQIKEIEPEISYIDYYSIHYAPSNQALVYVVDEHNRNVVSFNRSELSCANLPVQITKGTISLASVFLKNFSACISGSSIERLGHGLEEGESIEVFVKNINPERPTYLLLESSYRDWSLGNVYIDSHRDSISSPVSFGYLSRSKNIFRAGIFSIASILAFFGVGRVPVDDLTSKTSVETAKDLLSKTFDRNFARADVPPANRSLNISYVKNGESTHLTVIEPRYFQGSMSLVEIPPEAFNAQSVTVRITATKRHRVSVAQVFQVSSRPKPVQLSPLNLLKARHRRTGEDVTELLKNKDYTYLVTHPGDYVDVEFELPKVDTDQALFVLKADGFYHAASKEQQKAMGNWVEKLDPQARGFLQSLQRANAVPLATLSQK
jgi:hypothetical protein